MTYSIEQYRNILSIIEMLNEKGIDIVYIDNTFYVVGYYGNFTPSDNDVYSYHQLSGINITKYINARQGAQRITDNDFTIFQQELQGRKPYQRQFHKDIKFIWFQSYR